MTEVVYNSEHMKHFNYTHLPAHLQAISRPFAELAYDMTTKMQDSEERKMMLRKLLEAKDCAVRAYLDAPKSEGSPASALDTFVENADLPQA
jgi:hypothetical protein